MLKRTFLLSIPVAALLLASCSGGDHAAADKLMADQKAMLMADSTTKANVTAQENTTRALLEMLNTPGTDGLETMVTDNFVDHQMPEFITTPGIAGLKEEIALYHTAFPDFKQEITGMATNGDRTYVQLHITGTNTGAWGEMPATGKAFDVMGCDVMRFENGKAAEHWGYMEEAKMMKQLGILPAPGAKPTKKK